MVTIRDVARAAGVSIATVSRVARQPELVAESTRLKVQQAIDTLGYTANPAAASLRTLRTRKIIVTVPDIANPFFSKVLAGIEGVATELGHSVLLGNTGGDAGLEDRYARMLIRREADGMIFLGPRLPEPLRGMLAEHGPRAPIVAACEFDPALGVSGVRIDNEGAAQEAMAQIYALGHRDVAVITGPLDSPLSRARLDGVQRAARDASAEGRLVMGAGPFAAETGQAIAADLLARHRPTAIFCFSDELAFGAMAALRAMGLSCPDDVSLHGFDDVEMAHFVHPGLTTIHQPMRRIGAEAASLLFAAGAGAASRFALGLVVVAGISIGTLFTLFVLPAVYTWLATDHRAASQSQRLKEIAQAG